ncbi:hypothetical protein Kpol_1048p71 [Vanderwaltozyma polyspora DSM 70294]|uniref:Uncharacterized protein n=1 Tax=Vanderwaltozyma polyspora (strain ATCC 22028 / DSM 70294 / BCRC 21397 / CBS 2163 / NBRC 10782 / NRRL Y-8283 / UCD 57-17) TaxID=436907 RepID=A7TGN3_VANPO|nr:uncharacterized protein Kpol_1048p71 [Vanderwaltozyma polyspora DSM 70294]EDO18640.1 hypothetical protein Kpol_1048p71 [Vanderwaltozyma polyspora DSM 70294]
MKIVVFSGGTATNSLTPCFNSLSIDQKNDLSYVLPISDNGGSTSEILRVFGGPAIGDIRSRIVRLLNDLEIHDILAYRLPVSQTLAKLEWNQIVEGDHDIWLNISPELKELCRSFLINIQSEILKRSKVSNSFNFSTASIGNLFLTSIRLFMGGSLDSSIELMMRIGKASSNVNVIPCINTNHTHHISALLKDGNIITGQSQISHPSKTQSMSNSKTHVSTYYDEDFANPIYILPELRNSQLHFDKDDHDDSSSILPSPIEKIFYINPYGEEIKPKANRRVIDKIENSDLIVYSIGSLMTSLMPILNLGNISHSIYSLPLDKKIKKVLLINNKFDRETYGLSGYTYVKFIVDSMTNCLIDFCNDHDTKIDLDLLQENCPWNNFITDIVYLSKGEILLEPNDFKKHNISVHPIDSDIMENDSLCDILTKIYQQA